MKRGSRLAAAVLLAPIVACAESEPEPPPREREHRGAASVAGYAPATEAALRRLGFARLDVARGEVPLDRIRASMLVPRAPLGAPVDASHARADAGGLALGDGEPVLVARAAGDVRAWPLAWLVERELVQDELGGVPIAVTFCSLCGTAVVFERRVDGEPLTLEVSGLLLDGNSLLCDRESETLWRQSDGRAVLGVRTGRALATVPAIVLSLGALRSAAPDARVMQRPEELAGAPFETLAAEDVALGRPPRWLSAEGAAPLALELEVAGLDRRIGVAGGGGAPRLESHASIVVVHDPGTSTPYPSRDAVRVDARRAPPVGSAAAFSRIVGGKRIELRIESGVLVDAATGSHWDALGRAVRGPLAGRELAWPAQRLGFRFAFER